MRFVFGWHDVGQTPSATYTESAQPIPSVPSGDFKYVDITKTIAKHPDLFQIITPIHIDHFEKLLVSHPNHPLVNSMCHGLHVGFWPFADTEDPKLQPLGVVERQSGAPNLDDESITFLQKQRDHEIELGHYSRSFGSSLLPGMMAQPIFTVPKKGSSKL